MNDNLRNLISWKKLALGEATHESHISRDLKKLVLWYYTDSSDILEDHNILFEDIDLYDTLEELTIENDFFFSLPKNLKKFSKLKKLSISGCRFFDLTLENVPISVEIVDLSDQSNLSVEWMRGMQNLLNLKHIVLSDCHRVITYEGWDREDDTNREYDQYEIQNIIPYTPSLKSLTINSGCLGFFLDKEKEYWLDVRTKRVQNHPGFQAILPHVKIIDSDPDIACNNIRLNF